MNFIKSLILARVNKKLDELDVAVQNTMSKTITKLKSTKVKDIIDKKHDDNDILNIVTLQQEIKVLSEVYDKL